MMKMQKLLLLSGLGLMCFGAQGSADAAENPETSNNLESGITINILERDLSIRHVQSPSFGKQTLTGETQTVQSSRDLVVRIKDMRLSGDPWKLSYTFQPSEVADEHKEHLVFKIGMGTLSQVITEGDVESFVVESDDNYRASPIRRNHIGETTSNLLTLFQGNEVETVYEYRVPKEDITMDIPAGIEAGEYHGTQVLSLTNAPS